MDRGMDEPVEDALVRVGGVVAHDHDGVVDIAVGIGLVICAQVDLVRVSLVAAGGHVHCVGADLTKKG